MKNLPLEDQKAHLANEITNIEGQLLICKQKLDREPYGLMPIERIEACLDGVPFVDAEFPPNDASIFESGTQNLIDVVTHWRRPADFLRNES
jgi:hypothetical protein